MARRRTREEREAEEALVSMFSFGIWGVASLAAGTIKGISWLFSPKQKNRISYSEISLQQIDDMTGQEFELVLIASLLPTLGFTNINGTRYTGDYGVDIVAKRNNERYAIQCKRSNSHISLKAVQEIVAGKNHYHCTKAIVITNNYYTNSAIQLANENNVELLDRDDVIRMLHNVTGHLFCKKCGGTINIEALYCGNCGSKLKDTNQ